MLRLRYANHLKSLFDRNLRLRNKSPQNCQTLVPLSFLASFFAFFHHLHGKCHVIHPLSFFKLDSSNFLFDLLHKAVICDYTVNILQKCANRQFFLWLDLVVAHILTPFLHCTNFFASRQQKSHTKTLLNGASFVCGMTGFLHHNVHISQTTSPIIGAHI